MTQRSKSLLSLTSAAALMLLAIGAHAAVVQYYVSPTGDDNNDGETSATAFKTIQKAIDTAFAGHTIHVAAGTYPESLSWGKDLIILGAGAGKSIIDPSLGPGGRCLATSGLTSAATISGFTFQNGHTSYYGGGMYNEGSSPTVTNCTFIGNHADLQGGGMYNSFSSPTVTNCIFWGNSAADGGGMRNEGSSPTVTNCTFSGNHAGILGGGMYNSFSSPTVTNCIFWGNSAYSASEMYNYYSSSTTVTYCDIGGYASTPDANHNFGADPLFVDAANGNLRIPSGSPCVDVGNDASVPADITTDLAGKARIHGTHVDLGAYELPDNHTPTANAGDDQNNLALTHDGDPTTKTVSVVLEGSTSSDSDGDALSYAWDDGQHTASGATPIVPLSAGTYTFTLTVTDLYGASDTDTVQITVSSEPNDAPTADAQSLSLDQDNSLDITLTGSDPDPEDNLTYEVASGSAHGTLSGTAPDLTYTPDANYAGDDSFTFTVTDPYGKTSTATISLTVNDTAPPVITLLGDNPMTVNQGSLFTDPGATALDNRDGSVSVSVSGSVNTALPGTYTLTYSAEDAAGNPASKTRTVIVASALVIERVTVKRSSGSAQVKFVLRNTRTTTATNVRLTGATLGGVSPNPTLPLSLGSLSGGRSVSVTLTFKTSAGTKTLSLSGTSSFGGFSLTKSVQVP